MSLELVKQRGKVQHDYLFKFDEYVEGWVQFVGVNVKEGVPIISEVKWSEKLDDENNTERPVLNASLYRDFPIGKVTERITHYIKIESENYNEEFLNDTVKHLDYFTILEYAKMFTAVYPELQTKWKDERNVLLYVSYYLLFLNNFEGHTSSGDLHTDISNKLGITKSNSIQILNRLKKNGYLESYENTNSLLPSVKLVKLYVDNFVESTGTLLKVFRDELSELFFDRAEEHYFKSFEMQYWDEHGGDDWVADTTTSQQDNIVKEAFDHFIEGLDYNLEGYDLADICFMAPVSEINKYIEEVDDDGFVTFKIDKDTLSQLRKSPKYKNDHLLLFQDDLIDEILTDLGRENYLDNKNLIAKWAKEQELRKKIKDTESEEAPF